MGWIITIILLFVLVLWIVVSKTERKQNEKARFEKLKESEEKGKATFGKLKEHAENGDADAQYDLGVFIMNNRWEKSVPKDECNHIKWFEKAAKQGHKKAKEELEKNRIEKVEQRVKMMNAAEKIADQIEENKNDIIGKWATGTDGHHIFDFYGDGDIYHGFFDTYTTADKSRGTGGSWKVEGDVLYLLPDGSPANNYSPRTQVHRFRRKKGVLTLYPSDGGSQIEFKQVN